MNAHRSIGERIRYPRFVVGERVVLTKYAQDQGLARRASSPNGTVLKVGPTRLGVTVQRDGLKTPNHYWAGFWRHLKPQGTKANRTS